MAAAFLPAGAGASHSIPPPPPPPGHGQVLVRLVRPSGESGTLPNASVKLEPVELRLAGGAPGERWVRLPPLRPEFSAQDLEGGQVWVADAPVQDGEFDQVRLGGAGPQAPIGLRVGAGQWTILTLEVNLQAQGPLRLELRRARILRAQ